MNGYAKAREVCRAFVDEFQADLDFGPVLAYPAKPMEILGLRWFKWAGHGLGENVMYQYVEDKYMTADEYDEFIYDPPHFMTTKWKPRSFANLAGLSAFRQ